MFKSGYIPHNYAALSCVDSNQKKKKTLRCFGNGIVITCVVQRRSFSSPPSPHPSCSAAKGRNSHPVYQQSYDAMYFFFKPALAAPLHRSPSYVIQNLPNMPFLQSCLAGGVTSGLPIPSSGIPKKNVEAFLIVGTLVKAIDRLAAKKCKAI